MNEIEADLKVPAVIGYRAWRASRLKSDNSQFSSRTKFCCPLAQTRAIVEGA